MMKVVIEILHCPWGLLEVKKELKDFDRDMRICHKFRRKGLIMEHITQAQLSSTILWWGYLLSLRDRFYYKVANLILQIGCFSLLLILTKMQHPNILMFDNWFPKCSLFHRFIWILTSLIWESCRAKWESTMWSYHFGQETTHIFMWLSSEKPLNNWVWAKTLTSGLI